MACGRFTNERKIIGDVLKNQFFICNACEKVWCGPCMAQIRGRTQLQILRLAKKGHVLCLNCNRVSLIVKSPETLRFTQGEVSHELSYQETEELKICSVCGQEIRDKAIFCDLCGAKQ